MKYTQIVALSFLILLAVIQFVPFTVQAKSLLLIDCGYNSDGTPRPGAKPITKSTGTNAPANAVTTIEYECEFIDAIAEVKQLINFAFIVAMPVMVIAVAWAGIQILFAQGNMGKITEAKKMAQKVFIGFIFVLVAWLIVYTITSYLLKPEFYNVFLGDQNSSEIIN